MAVKSFITLTTEHEKTEKYVKHGGAATHRSSNSSKRQLIKTATHRNGNSSNALRRSLSLKNIFVAQLIERMATHRTPLRGGNLSNLL